MKKQIYFIVAILLTVTMVSCQKELISYQGKPDIYFNDPIAVSADSIAISYGFTTAQDSVQKVIVDVTGALSSADRPYKLEVDPSSTAVAGTHYDALPTSFFIKKNQVRDTLYIKFHRTPDMLTSTPVLVLNLVPNDNFVTEMKNKVVNATTGKTLSYIQYRILVNDIIAKPARWLDSYFGTFTRKKLFLICNYLNISPAYLNAGISVSELTAYSRVIQRYLNDQKAAGNTIYEDDGTIMAMGSAAQ